MHEGQNPTKNVRNRLRHPPLYSGVLETPALCRDRRRCSGPNIAWTRLGRPNATRPDHHHPIRPHNPPRNHHPPEYHRPGSTTRPPRPLSLSYSPIHYLRKVVAEYDKYPPLLVSPTLCCSSANDISSPLRLYTVLQVNVASRPTS